MRKKPRKFLAVLLIVALVLPFGGGIGSVAAADDDDRGDPVLSADFETGTDGWFKRGSETVTQVTYTAHTGEGSLLTEGRTETWNGPGVNADVLQPGATYDFSVYAKLKENTDGSAQIELTIQQQGLEGDEQYKGIASANVTADEWVHLHGQLTVDERASGYQVYVQSTDHATVDFYIDTFAVSLVSGGGSAETVVLHQTFEDDDVGGWVRKGWGGALEGEFEIADGEGIDGSKALRYYNRDSSESQPLLDLTEIMHAGQVYNISFKIRLGEGEGVYHIASKVDSDLVENQYPWMMGNQTVVADEWTTFAYTNYEVPEDTVELLIWIEPDDENRADIYIDEVLIVKIADVDTTGLLFDFEDGQLNGWESRNGSDPIEVVEGVNRTDGGNYSLLTTPAEQYQGPLLDILGKMAAGHMYDLSVWVRMKEGTPSERIRISVQHGPSEFTNVSANETVTDNEWVRLSGRFTLENTPEVLNAYVELADEPQPAGDRPFYIDDFELKYVGAVADSPPVQTDLDSLKELYESYFKIGAALENSHLSGKREELLHLHYNSLVAENVMKPEYMSLGLGEYDFSNGDVLADYVREHNNNSGDPFDLRFHTLVWHSQGSDWMLQDEEGNWLEATEANKELVLERMEDYIRAAIAQYADVLTDIDVVNEVIDEGRPDGMRESHWYRLTGKDYIRQAFIVAADELEKQGRRDEVRLYINDYSTHNPRKRDFLYDLVMELTAEGVPIDGIGHQTHINVSGPSIQQISDSIRLFGEAGFDNQLTELDVSVYTDNSTSYDPIPEEVLIRQGYRYKELFEELIRLDDLGRTDENPEGWISNVTLWGIADNHTWLHNRGTTRQDAPFPFDDQYQAKYAYWGMVEAADPERESQLPLNPKHAMTPFGTPELDGETDLVWSTVPPMHTDVSDTFRGTIRTLWDADYLYVRVDVEDETVNEGDQVEIFVEGMEPFVVSRTHADITEVEGGYALETAIELEGDNTLDRTVRFDVRITDMGENDGSEHGGNGAISSWSDPRHAQHLDEEGYGVLTFIEATKTGQAIYGTPTIDGEMDGRWNAANVYTTDVIVEQNGNASASAKFRTMWDEQYLYVYAEVTDELLSDESGNAWEQDSIEIFVDQNNGKTTAYENDDGQYRINFKNVRTVDGHANHDNYISVTKIVYDADQEAVGYVVETAIELDMITPQAGDVIGFDLQVNNDQNGNGIRDSVLIWNDPTGQSYMNTSRLGVMELVGDSGSSRNSGRSGGGIPETGQGSGMEAAIDADGRASLTIGEAAFQDALEKVENGVLRLDVTGAEDAVSVSVTFSSGQVAAASESGVRTIEVNAGIATAELPISLFSDLDRSVDIEFVVSKVDAADLPAQVRETVGDNPVYAFHLFAGSERISEFGAGDKVRVTYPYSPEAGQSPGQIVVYYIGSDGSMQVVTNGRYNPTAGQIEFKTNHFSSFTALHVQVNFTDTQELEWARDSIAALAAREIVSGISAESFAPRKEVTRAEFVRMLVETLDIQTDGDDVVFDDVVEGAWYASSISAAYAAGIVYGKDDGTFGVHDNITRQDMAVMTYRALQAAEIALETTDVHVTFDDSDAIADYALEAVSAMQQAGVISGIGNGEFAPLMTASRAQGAVILYQLLNQMH